MDGGGPQSSEKEKKGLRRIWKRIKHIFRHKPQSLAAEPAAPAPATKSTTARPGSDSKAAPTLEDPTLESRQPNIDNPALIEVDEMQESTSLPDEPLAVPVRESLSEYSNEQELRFLKAKAIFARYNIELNEADWVVRPKFQYERVSKPIRQRVRYTCHNCSTTFGYEKICMACQHRRCTQCSRYPPRKDRSRAARESTTQQQQQQDSASHVRRNSIEGACHECQTGFELGTQVCPNCQHQICDRCIQETTVSADQVLRRTDEQIPPTSRSTGVS
ncbi:hypothetical protein PV08_01787 [Exophiala spinifera]|uniref:Uncharacterized protein n=1 Tax=Exophiala spinifera TaxID=91928 RepID=A0A0D2A8U7_9EURO|nr:uncharacterized protein PV08_01787 [Exophiala spinifera]KIW21207.1 hypothetical protein PV08_01787 [Exophiala spinifera]